MAIFLKEAVFLMILVTVLCLPRRPFDAQLAPESIKSFINDEIEKEEVYPIRPITGAESADTSVERPARADVEEEEDDDEKEEEDEEEEEVYPTRPINVSKPDEEEKDDFEFLKSGKAFRTRRGVASNNKKWPKQGDKVNINYVFDGVNDETQTWLKDIFRELDLKTCIHFQHGEIGHYVKFTKGTGGCKSDIGYTERKPLQEVHLWNPGCDFRGTIMHEVLHLLGFYHEHQRYDRDNFIIIHKDNIQTGLSRQFDIIASQNLLAPYNGYDEHSIMQYDEFAFSKEDRVKKTMEARDGKELGQDSHMDANDIMKINHFYGCPALKFKDTKLTLKTADSFLAGTNGDVYVKLKGSQGESDFEQVTEGGRIADENEKGARETHNMAFRDVGKVNGIVVALVKKGALPSEKKKRSFESEEEKRKRWFSSDGWTVETIQLQTSDGTSATFPGGDLYEGDTKELSPS